MSNLKKKSDTGSYEAGAMGEVGPMNEHNNFVYYMEGPWKKERCPEWTNTSLGLGSGDPRQAPIRNPEILTPNNDTRLNELDQHKQNVLPEEVSKKFDQEDLKELNGFNYTASILDTDTLEDKNTVWGYNFKGRAPETNGVPPNNTGNQVPQSNTTRGKEPYSGVWGYNVPKQHTSPTNVPGMNQDDSGLAKDLEAKSSVTPSVKGKGVTPSVSNSVSNDLNGGSAGFSGTRGGKGSRGAKKARATLSEFVFTKEASTRVYTMPESNTRTDATPRNDQYPYNNDGKGMSSYTPEELKEIKKSPAFQKGTPVSTSTPSTFLSRLYNVDDEKFAEGEEVGTWDFFIIPTNQNVKHDVLTEQEKKEKNKRSTNRIY